MSLGRVVVVLPHLILLLLLSNPSGGCLSCCRIRLRLRLAGLIICRSLFTDNRILMRQARGFRVQCFQHRVSRRGVPFYRLRAQVLRGNNWFQLLSRRFGLEQDRGRCPFVQWMATLSDLLCWRRNVLPRCHFSTKAPVKSIQQVLTSPIDELGFLA